MAAPKKPNPPGAKSDKEFRNEIRKAVHEMRVELAHHQNGFLEYLNERIGILSVHLVVSSTARFERGTPLGSITLPGSAAHVSRRRL